MENGISGALELPGAMPEAEKPVCLECSGAGGGDGKGLGFLGANFGTATLQVSCYVN